MLEPNLSRRTVPSVAAPSRMTVRMYTIDVVSTAPIVPVGMDLDGSLRSPERFDPAMMPVTDGKKMASSTANDVLSAVSVTCMEAS